MKKTSFLHIGRVSTFYWALFLTTIALTAGSSRTAGAQPAESLSSSEVGADKSGPIMINFKIGPSIPLTFKDQPSGINVLDVLPVAASITIEGGYAFGRTRQAYLVLPLQFFAGSISNVAITRVVVPVGFQYDIPIKAVPGLYIYPRVAIGYMAYIASSGNLSSTSHGMLFAPEFGAKYVFRKRLNFAFEPFSLPLSFFTGKDFLGRQRDNYFLEYRINFSVGVNL